MKRVIVVAVLALSGCESDPDQTGFMDLMRGEGVDRMTMPDGRTGYLVNCDAQGFSACYDRARQICGGNFEVVTRTDRAGEVEDERRIEIVCET
jgi:hypothetical protein